MLPQTREPLPRTLRAVIRHAPGNCRSVFVTHELALGESEYGLNLVHAGIESLEVLLKPRELCQIEEDR